MNRKTLSVALFTALAVCIVEANADNPQVESGAFAVNSLGLALLAAVADEPGNKLHSPWSLQSTLGMLGKGAKGKTQQEMTKALFHGDNPAQFHSGMAAIREEFDAANQSGHGELRSANGIWVDASTNVQPAWKTFVEMHYGGASRAIDLKGADAATKTVNAWVSQETRGKITEILSPQDLLGAQSQSAVVVVNAVYFDFPWDEQFTKSLTRPAPFFVRKNQSKNGPFMFKQHSLGYLKTSESQIVALSYAGGKMQIVLVVPDAFDGLAVARRGLTVGIIKQCAKLPTTEVRLSLPRIKLELPSTDMKPVLQKLGIHAAFGHGADFSGMIPNAFVSTVRHQTFLELDEDGTKASAATAAVARPKNGHPREIPHMVVKADHPFLFFIQHIPTATCLFLGEVADAFPAAGFGEANASPPSEQDRQSPSKK